MIRLLLIDEQGNQTLQIKSYNLESILQVLSNY